VTFATVFAVTTSYRLDRAGLYYDEAHQAPAAFAYLNKPSSLFSLMPVHRIPLMNMPYSGAIKSAVYGLFMLLTGRPFTVHTWRILGIAFSVAGLLGFYFLVGDRLRRSTLLLFGILLVSDSNLVLQSAHDWGPVALAFLLRMLFLGMWVRQVDRPERSRNWFLLGLIVGVSVFEKLSSLVMLAPLCICAVMTPGFSRRRAWYVCGGLAIGSSPVVFVNLYTLLSQSYLLALSYHSVPSDSILSYFIQVLQVADGSAQRAFIFDVATPTWIGALEILGLVVLCFLALRSFSRRTARARTSQMTIASCALLSYVSIVVFLRFLPAATAENHWIIATPFQYLAIALALPSLLEGWETAPLAAALAYFGISVLMIARLAALGATWNAIRGDRYSPPWDPSVTVAARYLAALPPGTAFIAADWGIATQVFALSNGRQGYVSEPFWDVRADSTVLRILSDSHYNAVAVAALRPRSGVKPKATDAIFRTMDSVSAWQEIPVDTTIAHLRSIEIHRYRRLPSGAVERVSHPQR
jgi:hypothetical protein